MNKEIERICKKRDIEEMEKLIRKLDFKLEEEEFEELSKEEIIDTIEYLENEIKEIEQEENMTYDEYYFDTFIDN